MIIDNFTKKSKKWKSIRLYYYRKRKEINRNQRKNKKGIINSTINNTDISLMKNPEILSKKIINIPSSLSLYDHPNECLSKCNEILNCGNEFFNNEIYFNFSKCEKVDLSSLTLLDVYLQIIANKKKRENVEFKIGGCDSSSEKCNEMLEKVGIKKHFSFLCKGDENNTQAEFIDLIKAGKIRNIIEKKAPSKNNIEYNNFYKNSFLLDIDESIDSSVGATKLKNFYNKCLNKHGLTLNIDGERLLMSLISEVIDNCIIHSKINESFQWFLNAFYYHNDNDLPSINIVIFDFGKTIYEGLDEASRNNNKDETQIKMFNFMDKVYNEIKNKDRYFNKENIWTFLALQDGISRVKNKDDKLRGTGTIQLIDTFNTLGYSPDNSTKMCILSGKTMIRFNNKYKIYDNGGYKNISFNETNDILSPPNKDSVIKLKGKFPGTLISIEFYLDEKYIKERIK